MEVINKQTKLVATKLQIFTQSGELQWDELTQDFSCLSSFLLLSVYFAGKLVNQEWLMKFNQFILFAFTLAFGGLGLSSCGEQLTGGGEMATELDSVSYALGMDIARFYQKQEVPLNASQVYLGMRDVLEEGHAPQLSEAAAMTVIQGFQKRLQMEQQRQMQLDAAENDIRSQKFLETNRSKEGVVELPSGLQYKVLKTGVGASPNASNVVKVSYEGRLIDGTVFDSSENTGGSIEFGVTEVIPGWTEALLMMKPGDQWELFIPADLAYGQPGRPGTIPPNSTLVFEVELLEIVR